MLSKLIAGTDSGCHARDCDFSDGGVATRF